MGVVTLRSLLLPGRGKKAIEKWEQLEKKMPVGGAAAAHGLRSTAESANFSGGAWMAMLEVRI